jgi:hypothetical protein
MDTSSSGQQERTRLVKQLEHYLKGERYPNRAFIQEALRMTTLTDPQVKVLKQLTERVTMGKIRWAAYVQRAQEQLEQLKYVRPDENSLLEREGGA